MSDPAMSWNDFLKLVEGPKDDRTSWEEKTGLRFIDEYAIHRRGVNQEEFRERFTGGFELKFIMDMMFGQNQV